MREASFILSTTWLPSAIAESIDTLVLAFGLEGLGLVEADLAQVDPMALGLGWTQDGLVLTGLPGEGPVLLALPLLADEGQWTQDLVREAIAEHQGIVVCALGWDDRPLLAAPFHVSGNDPGQVHFLAVQEAL